LGGIFVEETSARAVEAHVAAPTDQPQRLAAGGHCAGLFGLQVEPLLPEVLQVEQISSQSTFTRFFNRFSQAANQSCFGQFYRWTLEQLSSRLEGYTLDLDTTGSDPRGPVMARTSPALPSR